MKKSISSRQSNVWVNYLLSLETQGETFHVINISWFSMKVYHKFCSFNICSSFSAGSIYGSTKRTLQYMPNKNLQQSKSFIVHVWHFKWRNFSTLTISMLEQVAFLWCIEVSVSKILWHKYWRHLFEIILGAK